MALKMHIVIRKLAEIEVSQTLDFLGSNHKEHSTKAGDISRSAAVDPDFADLAADAISQLNELLSFAEQSVVLGLYRVVELNSGKIAEWRWGADAVKSKQLFRADRLESQLKAVLQIDIKTLSGFYSVDELRLLNNAIKHEGVVSDKLANYPGWTAGDSFGNLDSFINRVAPDVPKYLEALALKIIPT